MKKLFFAALIATSMVSSTRTNGLGTIIKWSPVTVVINFAIAAVITGQDRILHNNNASTINTNPCTDALDLLTHNMKVYSHITLPLAIAATCALHQTYQGIGYVLSSITSGTKIAIIAAYDKITKRK